MYRGKELNLKYEVDTESQPGKLSWFLSEDWDKQTQN
jgi:hypothetical protein